MTIKELIKRLQEFDEDHEVLLRADTDCGYLTVKCSIEDVQFKNGKCVLYGSD